MAQKAFPVIGGPLDGQLLSVEVWQQIGFPHYGGYLGFNRSGYGRHAAKGKTSSMVWIHESLIPKI